MNKGLTITLIVLLSILLAGVVGVMIFLFKGDYNFNFDFAFGESKTLVEEKEIVNIKKLNIEANRADVIIEPKEEQTFIKVELYSDHVEEYEITEKEDEIKVVLKDENFVGFNTKGSRVKIYVPTVYDKDIKVVNKTGDIKVGKLSKSNIDISLTTGDITINEAKDIIASLTTGDVEITSANKATITGTTGDIDVDDINIIKVKLTTGDITLGDVNESLDLQSTTGDIEINTTNLTANSSIKSGTGDVKIRKTSNCYVDAKTKIGDTKVNNNDRKSDNVLTITSRVGDIRVN
jgi:DUF4097 and DUF4098 domain-containing protein YvlB